MKTLVFLATLASFGFAQAPLLEVKATNDGDALVNNYTQPATAIVLEWNKVQPDGSVQSSINYHDLLIMRRAPGTPMTIAPGAHLSLKPFADGRKDVRVLAVIYADGAIAGDPALANRVVDLRQFFYQDAAELVQLAETFLRQPDRDVDAFLRRLAERRNEHIAKIQEKLDVLPHLSTGRVDWVCETYIMGVDPRVLGREFPGSSDPRIQWDPQQRVQHAHESIAESADLLAASKPQLRAVNAPNEWRLSPAPPVTGDVPALETRWKPRPLDKGCDIQLRNPHKSTATAWTLLYVYSDGTAPRTVGWDTLGRNAQQIRPEATFYTGSIYRDVHPVKDVRLVAVVYEDGATIGPPPDVERLLAQRKYELMTLPKLLTILEQASQDGADLQALAAQLDSCKGKDPEWTNGTDNLPMANLCGDLARDLRGTTPLKELLARKVRLQQQYELVKAGKPAVE